MRLPIAYPEIHNHAFPFAFFSQVNLATGQYEDLNLTALKNDLQDNLWLLTINVLSYFMTYYGKYNHAKGLQGCWQAVTPPSMVGEVLSQDHDDQGCHLGFFQ